MKKSSFSLNFKPQIFFKTCISRTKSTDVIHTVNPIKCVYNADLKKEIYNFHMYLPCAIGNHHMFPTSIIQFSWTSVAGSECFLKNILGNLRRNHTED